MHYPQKQSITFEECHGYNENKIPDSWLDSLPTVSDGAEFFVDFEALPLDLFPPDFTGPEEDVLKVLRFSNPVESALADVTFTALRRF